MGNWQNSSSNTLTWVDGTNVDFTNFNSGGVDTLGCYFSNADGLWILGNSCTSLYQVICQTTIDPGFFFFNFFCSLLILIILIDCYYCFLFQFILLVYQIFLSQM